MCNRRKGVAHLSISINLHNMQKKVESKGVYLLMDIFEVN